MAHLVTPVSELDHVRGSENSPITVVEYGDFQCPFCGKAYFVLKQLQEMLPHRFAFRNFPLKQVHPMAVSAAEAAESAALQGKFWEMQDLLYENQNELTPENLMAFAQSLDLDIEKFQEDRHSNAVKHKIEDDFKKGVLSGVNGTPCLFINGKRYDNAIALDSLVQAMTSTSSI